MRLRYYGQQTQTLIERVAANGGDTNDQRLHRVSNDALLRRSGLQSSSGAYRALLLRLKLSDQLLYRSQQP